ncbi:MAG: proline racemase family protein [Megasphaera sp.]|jgi:proline racemase/trans-L-3-hydroxyproline dehydratase|nr:proline racemase family protein [Megasphaera sp.]MCI1248506.1 proline racemase family protein [Megasphaera sp.]
MWQANCSRFMEPLAGNPHFLVIDSHTMGEPTRIVVNGFPPIKGRTMIEKKNYIASQYDDYRRTVMLEPRGHANMFGAILMEPVHEEADMGVVFMDSGGYLNMCGHGSIGVATVLVEENMVPVQEPYTKIRLDTPSGIVNTVVQVRQGRVIDVTITNVPCFVYRTGVTVSTAEFGPVQMDICFGGSFFALVRADDIGLDLQSQNISHIIRSGMEILNQVNKQEQVHHPFLDIHSVDLVEFYGQADNPQATMKNAVVFGNSQIDRSPCGTGTSAKVASLYRQGKLKQDELFVYESIMGTLFKARVTGETMAGPFPAVIPQITGNAYITGINWLVADAFDPFRTGFQLHEQ